MKKRILAAGLAVLLTLCACSGPKQNKEQGQDTEGDLQVVGSNALNWQITETKLPEAVEPDNMPEGAWMEEILCEMAGKTLYYLGSVTAWGEDGSQYDIGYVVEKMEYPYEKWDICTYKGVEEWLEGESSTLWRYPWSASLSEDGTLSMLFDGEKVSYLCQWKDGEYSLRSLSDFEEKGISGMLQEDIMAIKDMFVHKNGDMYFANTISSGMKEYRQFYPDVEDGGWTACLQAEKNEGFYMRSYTETPGTVLCLRENPFIPPSYDVSGTLTQDFYLYMFGNTSDGEFYIQDGILGNQPLLTDDTVTMEEGDKAVWASEDSGYLCNRERIWKFETDTGMVQEAVYLPDYGYIGNSILDCGMGDNGNLRLLVSSIDGQKLLLELEGDVNTGKIIIELAVQDPDAALKQAVVRFNRSNEEYAVDLRKKEIGVTMDEFRTKIQAELAAGKGPDLLVDDAIADMEVMAEKKQLMVLTEFFQEEDMMPNVWECGKVGGDLYAVPYTYSIQTLVTSREMAEGRTGWTVEELVQSVRKSGVEQFCSSFGGETLFWHLCGGDGINTEIMDWENKTCHFDSRQARELLEFAAEYGGKTDYDSTGIKVLEGENFVSWGLMYGPSTFTDNICVYQDGQVYIGYPTAEGGSGHILDPDMVAVNPMTEHREGALAFVQYLASEEWQEYMVERMCRMDLGMRLPVRRQALEHLYEYLLKEPPEEGEEEEEDAIYYQYGVGVIYGDYEFPMLPFTEENVEQMRRVIETASSRRAGSLTILDIITEETEGFFAGNKSADEVLSVLQNRIQLYFDEN